MRISVSGTSLLPAPSKALRNESAKSTVSLVAASGAAWVCMMSEAKVIETPQFQVLLGTYR